MSEPASGSDAFALRTKAVKQDNGDYILNGSKVGSGPINVYTECKIDALLADVDHKFC